MNQSFPEGPKPNNPQKICSSPSWITRRCNFCKTLYYSILEHHPEWGRWLQFLAVGFAGFICNLLLLSLLLALGTPVKPALAIGIAFATLINFYGDRVLVFAYAKEGKIITQFIGFIAVCFCGALINYFVTLTLLNYFERISPQIALIGGIIVATIFNYACLRLFVFKSSPSDA